MKEDLAFFQTSGGNAVKIGPRSEQLCLIVHKVRIGIRVCNQVDRILQNRLDGKPGERTPGFCFDALPQQLSLGHGQGIVLLVEVVRSRFMKLNADHIRFVLKCLAESTAPVRNMKQYLLAALYNAPTTMQLYYQNQTNHDLSNRG